MPDSLPVDADVEMDYSTPVESSEGSPGDRRVATASNEGMPDESKPLDGNHVTGGDTHRHPSPSEGRRASSASRDKSIDQTQNSGRSSPPAQETPAPARVETVEHISSTPATASKLPNSVKLDKEIARLTEVVRETSSQAAGKVLQKYWREFLFKDNDDEHLCWILRAGLKNATPNVIERVMREQNVSHALIDKASRKKQVVKTVLNNATYAQLLDYVPEDVLDRALSERLKNAPAKQIIKWLAEAERLGFREDDILDDEDESVIPFMGPDSQDGDAEMTDEPTHQNLAAHDRDPLLAEQERNAALLQQQAPRAQPVKNGPAPLMCPLCYHQFTTQSGYNYHLLKKVCQKRPPAGGFKWICGNCAQGFTTKQGMQYHVNFKKVCMEEGIAPATSPSLQLQREAGNAVTLPPQRHTEPILPPPRPTFSAAPQYGGPPQYGARPPQHEIPRPPQFEARPPQHEFPRPPPPPPPPHYESPRPTFTPHAHPQSAPRPAQHEPPRYSPRHEPPSSQPARPSMGVTIPRPPLYTPSSQPARPTHHSPPLSQTPTSDSSRRQSPSELPPQKLAELNKALSDQEARYQSLIAGVDPHLSPADRAAKLQSLKNANATRKSQIRRAFGVTIRMKERDKLARDAASTPTPTSTSFDAYRATGFAPVNSQPGSSLSIHSYVPPPPKRQRVEEPAAERKQPSTQGASERRPSMGGERRESERRASIDAGRKEAERRASIDAVRKEGERRASIDAVRKEADRKQAQAEAITILSDTESEDEDMDMDNDRGRASASRGSFMARRGGKR